MLAGQISASLASFSRTIDDYSGLAKSELIPEKKEKATEREKNFRTALSDYRQQFERLRKEREEAVRTSHFPFYPITLANENCPGIGHESQ